MDRFDDDRILANGDDRLGFVLHAERAEDSSRRHRRAKQQPRQEQDSLPGQPDRRAVALDETVPLERRNQRRGRIRPVGSPVIVERR
ncbi:hypothetical protein [Mesorhizobium sp. M6A.T.Ce.TU.002.03.1.1]|uniref:hypothetical protein n=1 Tax=Mesorhizobium sp. M6A.T.Ce.TU.002.03.1.1 TaxID=2496782 RepID=UPI0013E0AE77|nr:hypothetical protein [Mesorhizobium sp. M6A.T.Ce.TU.002.03.1.1]